MTIAHKSPIVRSIVFNLIREIHFEKFKVSKEYVLDVSLIPVLDEKFIGKKGYVPSKTHIIKKELVVPIKRKIIFGGAVQEDSSEDSFGKTMEQVLGDFKESIMDNSFKRGEINKEEKTISLLDLPKGPKMREEQIRKIPIKIIPINIMISPPNYGKLNPFFRDISVSMIICDGPEKPVKIIRQGKEQITNVLLLKQEIMNLLYQISAKTRIPLVEEGVYRVSWDDYIINAIVSEVIEPSFVIKKI